MFCNASSHTSIIIIGLVLLAACGSAPGPEPADTVYMNGSIYTVDDGNLRAEAVAIRDGLFVYVGDDAGAQEFIGPGTERVDLAGRMAMPGLYDLHIHFLMGSEETMFGCRFSESAEPAAITAAVKACVENGSQQTTGWIVGGSWNAGFLSQPEIFNKSILDEVAPDIPILLWNNSHHDALANSKALELLDITRETSNPEDGHIGRDPDTGEPNGILVEKAAFEAGAKLPHASREELVVAMKQTQAVLNRLGVLGVKEAGATSHFMAAYKDMDDQDELTLRVAVSILWQPSFMGPAEDALDLVKRRRDYQGERVGTDFVKMFLDGAPPGKTAAFLDPYVADEQFGADYRGQLIDPEQLKEDLVLLDSMGVTVKMHAAGDASVRAALDAVEAARQANGDSGLLHEVSHASFIHPDDIPRFAQLGAVAEFSPVIWHPHPVLVYLATFLDGGRVDRMWPIRSLVESGALAIAGSDWPTVGAAIPNPWLAIEAMVTRKHPSGEFPGAQWPEQALPLEQVLEIYTINGARGIRQDEVTGSIQVGKSADMIILDRNLFEIEPEDISDTKILAAVFEGRVIHSQ